MKKLIFATLLFLTVLFIGSPSLAWDDCPRGEVNDPAPGDCSLYVDTDKNGICDHSEPAPEDRATDSNNISSQESATTTILEADKESLPELSGRDLKLKTVAEVADFYSVNVTEFENALESYLKVGINSSDTFQLLHDNYGAEPSKVKEVVLSVKNGSDVILADTEDNPASSKPEKKYYFGPVSIAMILIYLVSFLLYKYKAISLLTHRRVWNVLLLITFLISGILGLILTIRINYGINFTMPFNMLFWHVEAGIAMSLISIFHILWHIPYYKAIFRKSRLKTA